MYYEESCERLKVKFKSKHSQWPPYKWLLEQKPFISILFFRRKFLKLIGFRCKRDHCPDKFISNENLTEFELYACELLKFLLRSITQLHAKEYLNDPFCHENSLRSTPRSAQNLLKFSAPKSVLIKQSIMY